VRADGDDDPTGGTDHVTAAAGESAEPQDSAAMLIDTFGAEIVAEQPEKE
jgi:hypothetical protein